LNTLESQGRSLLRFLHVIARLIGTRKHRPCLPLLTSIGPREQLGSTQCAPRIVTCSARDHVRL
jgi:hypothetical protein